MNDIHTNQKRSPIGNALLNLILFGISYLNLNLYKRFFAVYGILFVLIGFEIFSKNLATGIQISLAPFFNYYPFLILFFVFIDTFLKVRKINSGTFQAPPKNKPLSIIGFIFILLILGYTVTAPFTNKPSPFGASHDTLMEWKKDYDASFETLETDQFSLKYDKKLYHISDSEILPTTVELLSDRKISSFQTYLDKKRFGTIIAIYTSNTPDASLFVTSETPKTVSTDFQLGYKPSTFRKYDTNAGKTEVQHISQERADGKYIIVEAELNKDNIGNRIMQLLDIKNDFSHRYSQTPEDLSIEPTENAIQRINKNEELSNTATSTYSGYYFSVEYPSIFEPRPIPTNGFAETDEAYFLSPNGLVEFYIYSPLWSGTPDYLTILPTEELVSEKTENAERLPLHTVGTHRVLRWVTVKAKDNSYYRSFHSIKSQISDVPTDPRKGRGLHHVFGIKYKDEGSYAAYKDQYIAFKNSLQQSAD
jgi:hypothetical protein